VCADPEPKALGYITNYGLSCLFNMDTQWDKKRIIDMARQWLNDEPLEVWIVRSSDGIK
jgi:hypothetical protein